MVNNSGASAASKAFRLLRERPGHLYRRGREFFLFHWARFLRMIFSSPGIALADNVRLQRNGSLMAESPLATISIGANSVVYEEAQLEAYKSGSITVGPDSIIGPARIYSRYRITIGARFLCSWNVFIQDYDSHPTQRNLRQIQIAQMIQDFRPSFKFPEEISEDGQDRTRLNWDFPGDEIKIGDDVWLGAGVTILKGASIGSGSVVATGAVVIRGIYPENSLLAGNPAVVVKEIKDKV